MRSQQVDSPQYEVALRKQDLVVANYPQPFRSPDIDLLVALVVAQSFEKMCLLSWSQDLGVFWKVRHKGENQEGDADRQDPLQDEYPPPSLAALYTVHPSDTICEKTAETRTEYAEGKEHGEAERCLLAGIVFGD
jgi:hypothetical protein